MRLGDRVRAITRVIRRMIGAPDYESYVKHMTRTHPEQARLSADEFAADALARRYNRPGSRCC